MRIFHLVPNLNYGGLQKIVRLLAVSQRHSGHSVTIGCWTNASNHPEAECELDWAGIHVNYIRRAADGGMLSGRKCLLKKLKNDLLVANADILHIHNPFSYYLYGALAGRAAGRMKIVNTIHLTAMFDHPRFGRRGRALFRAAALFSHGIVSVCPEMDTFLRARFFLPGLRRFVVDNGIDLAPFLAVPARHSREEVVFGFAGRMAPEKNHRVLIEAFGLLRRRNSHVRLRLLGGGPLEPELKQKIHNQGLFEAIEFCGFGHDVPGFLKGLDVYVLPSDFEGLPLSLLEAIASGLPVVATAVDGVPRVVESTDSGWLCPPNNPDALMAAMEAAMVCPDRRERVERSRRLVEQRFSAERMANDYERVYAELLQSG